MKFKILLIALMGGLLLVSGATSTRNIAPAPVLAEHPRQEASIIHDAAVRASRLPGTAYVSYYIQNANEVWIAVLVLPVVGVESIQDWYVLSYRWDGMRWNYVGMWHWLHKSD